MKAPRKTVKRPIYRYNKAVEIDEKIEKKEDDTKDTKTNNIQTVLDAEQIDFDSKIEESLSVDQLDDLDNNDFPFSLPEIDDIENEPLDFSLPLDIDVWI